MAGQASTQWATLTITLAPETVDADARFRLDELGAILAMRDDVDGVQTLAPELDPKSASTEIGLCVFTRPHELASLEPVATSLLEAHDLTATLQPAVHDDERWHDAWKAFYRPLRFGDNTLLVRPSWIERQPDDPTLEVRLDPGRAFGTGLHPTTQLCIERLCTLAAQGHTPVSLLDLGCGSGILAMAALRLFPELRRLVAIDNDPEATETTRENAALNELASRLTVVTGTLHEAPPERFDLIVANIRPEVLIPIAPDLADALSEGGQLTVSGILPEESHEVDAAYRAAGWRRIGETRHFDGWSSLDLERA